MKDADGASAPPLRAAEAFAFAGIVLVFFLLRIPLLRGDGLLLGWNSDAAIFGLMAKAIAEGRDLPLFFWGQSYMGPLTAYLAAAVGMLLGHVGPLALRLAVAIEVVAAIAFYWLGLRRGFGRGAALLTALWLAIGPGFLFRFVSAPIGAEQVFVLGGAIFWFAAQTGLRRVRDGFVFGLLAGLGWWINQGIVFAAGAAVAVAVIGPCVWSTLRDALRFTARVAVRPERLDWREPDRVTLLLVRAIQIVLIVVLVLGVLRAAQFSVPAFFLFEPVQEPLIAIAAYNVILELLFGTRLRAWMMRARWLPQGIAAIAGAAIGYAPVIVGGIAGAYPKTYGFSAPF
ncbi:MAG TPA: glycosyltransferase family 39 protein, partial [Thermoanaerobaculia bacterium]|nr:glycosyltransferase family 39 protein [Thermoanaerobaculia bacterium]